MVHRAQAASAVVEHAERVLAVLPGALEPDEGEPLVVEPLRVGHRLRRDRPAAAPRQEVGGPHVGQGLR